MQNGLCSAEGGVSVGRPAVCLLVALALILSAGCYGSFPLTNMVYKFNGNITDSDLIHTVVMWIFVIIPVYEVVMIVDAIVPNLIEFWTEEGLISSTRTELNGGMLSVGPADEGNELVVRFGSADAPRDVLRFVKQPDGVVNVLDQSGGKVGEVHRLADGGLSLCDSTGRPIREVTAAQIASLRSSRLHSGWDGRPAAVSGFARP